MSHARTLTIGALLLGLLLPTGLALAVEAKPLRLAVVPAWAPPYGMFRDGALVGGISFELAQAIGEAARIPVQHVLLPRPRVDAAVANGEVDMRCHLSTDWVRNPEAYVWTGPLFELVNVVVGHQSAEPLTSLDGVPRGQSIGTVLGFVYPGVEERVADGRLRRDDTIAVERSLQKLSLNRNAYAIAEQREVSWYMRNTPNHALAAWRLPLYRTDYRCALLKGQRSDTAELLAIIERLRSNGSIERILAKYSPLQPVVVTNSRSSLTRLNRQELEDLYTGKTLTLPDGSPAQLLGLGGPLRDEFFAKVLERDAAQVKAAWSKLVFSGKGRAPRELADLSQLRAALAAHPGAIAYLDASQVDASMKVLYAH